MTGGDGVGRLLECTGAEYMVNNCFSLLRYVSQLSHSTTILIFVHMMCRKDGYVGMIGLPKVRISHVMVV